MNDVVKPVLGQSTEVSNLSTPDKLINNGLDDGDNKIHHYEDEISSDVSDTDEKTVPRDSLFEGPE